MIWGDLNLSCFFLLVSLFFFFFSVSRILCTLTVLYSSAILALCSSAFFVWSFVFSVLLALSFFFVQIVFFNCRLFILQKDFLDLEFSTFYFPSIFFLSLEPRVLNLYSVIFKFVDDYIFFSFLLFFDFDLSWIKEPFWSECLFLSKEWFTYSNGSCSWIFSERSWFSLKYFSSLFFFWKLSSPIWLKSISSSSSSENYS